MINTIDQYYESDISRQCFSLLHIQSTAHYELGFSENSLLQGREKYLEYSMICASTFCPFIKTNFIKFTFQIMKRTQLIMDQNNISYCFEEILLFDT